MCTCVCVYRCMCVLYISVYKGITYVQKVAYDYLMHTHMHTQCTCIHTCTHFIHAHTCTHFIHAHTCTHFIHAHTCTHFIHAHTSYMHTHAHTSYMHTHAHTSYMHTHAHTSYMHTLHTHMHTHMHTHTHFAHAPHTPTAELPVVSLSGNRAGVHVTISIPTFLHKQLPEAVFSAEGISVCPVLFNTCKDWGRVL